MVATIQLHEMTGSVSGEDKTSDTVRFKAADNTTVDTNDRLVIPASGEADIFSYSKQLRFYGSTDPDVDIDNLKLYSDGSNDLGTGAVVDYDLSGEFGANINTDISGTDLFTKTSGSPIDMDGDNPGPWGTGEIPCYMGDFVRLQMGISETASPGSLSAETLTFAYDET